MTPAEGAGVTEINLPDVVAAAAVAFARYEAALVSNDVATLDTLFWESAHTIRYGVAGVLYGSAGIHAFRADRPSAGLACSLERTVITTFGRDAATASTVFRQHARQAGTADADLDTLAGRLAGGGGACQRRGRMSITATAVADQGSGSSGCAG